MLASPSSPNDDDQTPAAASSTNPETAAATAAARSAAGDAPTITAPKGARVEVRSLAEPTPQSEDEWRLRWRAAERELGQLATRCEREELALNGTELLVQGLRLLMEALIEEGRITRLEAMARLNEYQLLYARPALEQAVVTRDQTRLHGHPVVDAPALVLPSAPKVASLPKVAGQRHAGKPALQIVKR